MSDWQDIASAPDDEVVLVCDTVNGETPYTIAKARQEEPGVWYYSGTIEEIDFKPAYWIERNVRTNPFYIPLPTPPETA